MLEVRVSKKSRVGYAWAIGIAVALVAVVGSVIVWYSLQSRHKPLTDGQLLTKVTEEVSRHMVLPADEKPQLALIKDSSKVSDQPFFVSARSGDYLLIYEKSKTAILYRESIDRLVKVGSITTDTTAPAMSKVTPGSGDIKQNPFAQ